MWRWGFHREGGACHEQLGGCGRGRGYWAGGGVSGGGVIRQEAGLLGRGRGYLAGGGLPEAAHVGQDLLGGDGHLLQHRLQPHPHHGRQPAHQRRGDVRRQPPLRAQRASGGATATGGRDTRGSRKGQGSPSRHPPRLTMRSLMRAPSAARSPRRQCRFRARHSNSPRLQSSSSRGPKLPSGDWGGGVGSGQTHRGPTATPGNPQKTP